MCVPIMETGLYFKVQDSSLIVYNTDINPEIHEVNDLQEEYEYRLLSDGPFIGTSELILLKTTFKELPSSYGPAFPILDSGTAG